MNWLAACLLLIAPTLASASEDARKSLIAQIVDAATHEHKDRRHTVSIHDCFMTTFVFEDWNEHPKVLWSSFHIDLRALTFSDPNSDGDRFIWSPDYDENGLGLAVIPMEMRQPATARHEMAMRRNPKPPFTLSPREGVDRYVYKPKTNFYIIQLGLPSKDKPAAFIAGIEQYRLEYCTPIG